MASLKGQNIIQAEVSHFKIVLPFLIREYKVLASLGTNEKIGDNQYEWTFKYEDWDKVQNALGGRILQHDQNHMLMDVLKHCDPLIKDVTVELHRKGKGTLTVVVEGEGYRVSWYQGGELKGYLVSRSLVELIWDEVISKNKIGEPIRSRDVVACIVKAIGNEHWNYPIMVDDKENKYMRKCIKEGKWNHARSQDFDWTKFFGCRGDYNRIFYVPIKCLVALGWITHRKDGHIIRVGSSEKFNKEARIDEIILLEKEMEASALRPENPDDILEWSEKFK